MKALSTTLLAATLLGLTPCVLAASGVDLTLKGSITPSACVPTLTQDGTVDYGKIAAKELSMNSSTELPPANLQLSVNCEAPTLFALNGKDNRFGTAHYSALNWAYGLGLINGTEKLGSYGIDVLNPVSDVVLYPLFSFNNGQSWLMNPSGSYMSHSALNAFTDIPGSGPHFPAALRNITVDLRISTDIAPARTLTLTEEVPLDGSASLDLLYL
ncbi:DUF1120 domain-containing protein [Pseudomonas sp. PDM05]|jgi:hypothetical protein|uniref:DUF1120 domain-containing protein n=1 Tax=Pseudomonas sp. PDM05 TaxID=2769301 RepID=UPI00178325AB|nr:DUF1120 domain-containing protein [Pseudomonas sp. PDM05]MBD9457212.1 DUF1120 domain-containing protein [Pseudomonas sp. PDM05]